MVKYDKECPPSTIPPTLFRSHASVNLPPTIVAVPSTLQYGVVVSSAGGGAFSSAVELKTVSAVMDEATRVGEQAHKCAESGRKGEAVEMFREAASNLWSLVEAHAADLGEVLLQELQERAATYSQKAAEIAKKLDKARAMRNGLVKELRDTEKSYLQELRTMESIYHAQIVADLQSVAPVIKSHDENIVFCQLKMLIKYSHNLYQEICFLCPEQPGVPDLDDGTFQRLLGVLEQNFDGLDLLQRYVEKLGEAQSIVDMWKGDEKVRQSCMAKISWLLSAKCSRRQCF